MSRRRHPRRKTGSGRFAQLPLTVLGHLGSHANSEIELLLESIIEDWWMQ